jgi:membrane protease YdiL (CAAX protease family)
MTSKIKKPPSGFIYAIISVALAASLPLAYGLFMALTATQDFATGIISGEYTDLDDYLYDSIITTDFLLISQALMWGGMLVGPLLAALRKVKLWLDDTKVLALGFRSKWIWVGLLVGIAAQTAILTFGALVQAAYPESGLEGNAGEILESFSGLNIAVILFMVVLGAPIVEEILYRGLVFTAISNKFGVLAGGVISSLIFGFSHVSSFSINGIFTGLATAVLGGILVYARVKSKGLFLPIMIHFTFNGISGLAIVAAEILL